MNKLAFGALGFCAFSFHCGIASQLAPPVDACGLLSAVDVEQALRIRIDGSSPRVHLSSITSCVFTHHGETVASVVLHRNVSGVWAGNQKHRMIVSGTYRNLADLGQPGFIWGRGGNGATACLFLEPDYLQISVFGAGAGRNELLMITRRALSSLSGSRNVAPGQWRPGL